MVVTFECICSEESVQCDDTTESTDTSSPDCVLKEDHAYSIFGNCCGFGYICMAFLSVILFLSATIYIVLYLSSHGKGFKWRDYSSSEDVIRTGNLHGLLTVLGFITMCGIGITVYRAFPCCDHNAIRVLHVIWQLAAGTLICIGLWLSYEIHDKNKSKHFNSVHSWVGVAACALFALELLCGFLKFIIFTICGPLLCCFRASCIPVHAAIGISAYWAAIAASVIAMQKDTLKTEISSNKNRLIYFLDFNDWVYDWLSESRNPTNKDGETIPGVNVHRATRPPFIPHRPKLVPPNVARKISAELQAKNNCASGFTLILVACGILVTYSVISHMIHRR